MNEQEQNAKNVYRGQWDANGTTAAYFPDHIAYALLRARGWMRSDRCWLSPSDVRYWETGDALQIALAAEVC